MAKDFIQFWDLEKADEILSYIEKAKLMIDSNFHAPPDFMALQDKAVKHLESAYEYMSRIKKKQEIYTRLNSDFI